MTDGPVLSGLAAQLCLTVFRVSRVQQTTLLSYSGCGSFYVPESGTLYTLAPHNWFPVSCSANLKESTMPALDAGLSVARKKPGGGRHSHVGLGCAGDCNDPTGGHGWDLLSSEWDP